MDMLDSARSARYRTIVVSDACTADNDESHSNSLDVLRKWFAETPTADDVLNTLGAPRVKLAHA
jgi:nicotinamidase-related amidase